MLRYSLFWLSRKAAVILSKPAVSVKRIRLGGLMMGVFGTLTTVIFVLLMWIAYNDREYCHVISLDDPYVISSCRLPPDIRMRPSYGNGHVATVVHSTAVCMNGLYNGREINSHRALIPSPLMVKVTSVNGKSVHNGSFTLDMRKGIFMEYIFTPEAVVLLKWYAHRTILPLMVVKVSVNRTAAAIDPLVVTLSVNQWGTSPDLDLETLGSCTLNASCRFGRTKESETEKSSRQTVFLIFNEIPSVLTVRSGEQHHSWTFLASVHVNRSHAVDAFVRGVRLQESGQLTVTHIQGWSSLWEHGRIEVDGNGSLPNILAASQYYLYSSIPSNTSDDSWPFVGLSPSGLAWGDDDNYLGHVFWDQETWMYPPLLMMHADLGRMLLSTRLRTMPAAQENANMTGYRGIRYPWESAFTGTETAPDKVCAKQEIHINGDISFAMQQYLRATGDYGILSNGSYTAVVFGIADFWISRMQYNNTLKLYEILEVVPPDEYAVGVNNSAFTNMVAATALEFASEVARLCHLADREKLYHSYAQQIYIPFDAKIGCHPEYDGCNIGKTVKQADVVLMGFPFMWNMTREVRLKDLQTYEPITSEHGPAMSDSMFAIAWLELKQYDLAARSFSKMFDHIAGDFLVWTEEKHSKGATNFITGVGGFLQSLVFGFGGIRLRSSSLDIDPVLPPYCSALHLIGLDYLDSSLTVSVFIDKTVAVTLTSKGNLPLCLTSEGQTVRLELNRTVTLRWDTATSISKCMMTGEPALIRRLL